MLFRGLFFIFKEIAKKAEEELTDTEPIKRELANLYRKLERGEISEDEFDRREAELVERLEQIENYKEEKYSAY